MIPGRKQEIKNRAVRQQIALDTKERNVIDALREHEKNTAMIDLEEWKQKQKIQAKNEIVAKYKCKYKSSLDNFSLFC